MFIVYILQSEKNQRYYIGHTQDLNIRLKKHNSGSVQSTRFGRPWVVVYKEIFRSKSTAYRKELEIKSYKGGVQFKEILRLKNI